MGLSLRPTGKKNYTKNLCLAGNTIPDCAAPGPAELDSVAASNFAAYDCSSRDPVSSRVGRAATEILASGCPATKPQRRQGAEKKGKINRVHRDYTVCAAKLFTL